MLLEGLVLCSFLEKSFSWGVEREVNSKTNGSSN